MMLDSESNIMNHVKNRLNEIKVIKDSEFSYPLSIPTYDENEILQAIDSMVTHRTTMWEKVAEFERQFGQKYGGEAIMVNSGSSADLIISFALLNKSGGPLKPGSKVLIPAVTWPTQIWSVLMAGFRVELVDVDPTTLNMDMKDFRKKINSDVSAVFLVNLLGNCCDIQEVQDTCRDLKIILLEDCCESLGSKFNSKFFGTFGLASSFSFFFAHHMVTMEGGMVLTRDSSFAERCRQLRAHGWARSYTKPIKEMNFRSRYNFVNWGFNVRPTELQGGFGIEQIKKIDYFHDVRIKNAQKLQLMIKKYQPFLSTMQISDKVECSWFAFPILISIESPFTLSELSDFLENNGVETRPIVAGNIAKQPAMSNFPEVEFSNLNGADFIHENGLYIGIHPKDSSKKILRIENLLDLFVEKYK